MWASSFQEIFLFFFSIISLWEFYVAIIHAPYGNHSSCLISPKTLYSLSPNWWHYMKFDHICPTDIRDILLWKCKQTTMTDEVTDRWRTPGSFHTNRTFRSSELKRQLKRQKVPNPSIFLCIKQFRSFQND